MVVFDRKAPVAYYHEGARHRQVRHFALRQRLVWTHGEQLDIRLVSRYIYSELNPADIFSRLTDHDSWTLSPSVQRMLM